MSDIWELHRVLRQLYEEYDAEVREKFHRSLPFGDTIFDRWERAKNLGFGPGASIYNSAALYGTVTVGRETWIGPYTLLDGSGGGLTIGDYCSISAGVHIYTHDTVLWALSSGQLKRREGAVRIGSCVYIGSQSVIAAGVHIGTRCVIGANSFVNTDVPDRTIVGGSPAKVLGTVSGAGRDVTLEYL